MESSGSLEHVEARTEIKMICVAEDDFSLYVFLEIPVVYALHGTDRTHRHEDRSLYLTVVGSDDSASGCGLGIVMSLYEFHSESF